MTSFLRRSPTVTLFTVITAAVVEHTETMMSARHHIALDNIYGERFSM